MTDCIGSLIAALEIALAAFGLGRPALRLLRIDFDDRLTLGVWSVTLGLVLAGTVWTTMGLLGILYWPLIVGLTMLACCAGIIELTLGWQDMLAEHGSRRAGHLGLVENLPAPTDDLQPRSSWLLPLAVVLGGVAALAALLSALAPPTAGEALRYHLHVSKALLEQHGIVRDPLSGQLARPLLAEAWFAWALALESGVAAQLLHWGLGILLALATVLLAAPIVGPRWSWAAGAIALLIPGVSEQMGAALNDLATATLTTLALIAWRTAADREQRGWSIVAGLMAGAALAIKPLAVAFLVAIGVAWRWDRNRDIGRRAMTLAHASPLCLAALLVAGPWYVWAMWHHGVSVRPVSEQAIFTDAAAWQRSIWPEPFGGRFHQLGALFLVTLPPLLVMRRLRGLGRLLVISAVYAMTWYAVDGEPRSLMPVVPLLSIAAAWSLAELNRFPLLPRLLSSTAVAAALLGGAIVPLERCRDKLAVATGFESREAYLLRSEPTYPAAYLAGRLLGDDARLLSQDDRSYYFDLPVVRESAYRRANSYPPSDSPTLGWAEQLRAAGFTHLLLADVEGESGAGSLSPLGRWTDAELNAVEGVAPQCLVEYTFDETDGTRRRYRLVELPGGRQRHPDAARLADAPEQSPRGQQR